MGITATLNQAGHLVAFFSCTLIPTECKHVTDEKEKCTIIEAVKKWTHYLSGQKFTIVTNQLAVNYMFHVKRLGEIKNNQIQWWMMELECYKYNRQKKTPLSRAHCGAVINKKKIIDLLFCQYYPGIIRLDHFIRI